MFFSEGCKGRLTAITTLRTALVSSTFSSVPQVSTCMCVYVCAWLCWRCISACIHEISLVHKFLGAATSPHTYIGCLRGLQLGRPSLSKALRSQRHQLSMTSPFPAHQYELIVALFKACKGNRWGERNAIISWNMLFLSIYAYPTPSTAHLLH